nr:hypothetical protein [uncultured Dyadobacter sp.]
MKQVKIMGNLFKCLLLSVLLAACNNDEVVTPADQASTAVGDRNARLDPLTRLVNDEGFPIQYKKSGKFFGKISKLGNAPVNYQYVTYTYDDSNPAALWISKKTYKSSNNSLIGEHNFKIINGLCIESIDKKGNLFEYKYNPQGYLDEVNKSDTAYVLKESWKYQYDWIYRLTKIKHQKDGKPYHTYNFTYTQIEDKYPLNFPTDNIDDINYNHIGGSYIGGINDKYLPYFGKHTSPLIDVMIDNNDVTGQIMTGASIYFSGYVVDGDGLVLSKNLTQYSVGWTETFSYSATSWQGIP